MMRPKPNTVRTTPPFRLAFDATQPQRAARWLTCCLLAAASSAFLPTLPSDLSTTALAQNTSDTAWAKRVAELESKVAQLQNENDALRQQVRNLQNQLNQSQQSTQDLKKENAALGKLAALPSQQDIPNARMVAEFNPQTGTTLVVGKPMTIPESTKLLEVVHGFGVGLVYQGNATAAATGNTTTQAPITQAFLLIDTFDNTNTRYRDLSYVQLVAGGKTHTLKLGDHQVLDQNTSGGRRKITRYDERLTIPVDLAELRDIATQTPLVLKIGDRSFPLTHDHEALLDAAAERVRLAPAATPNTTKRGFDGRPIPTPAPGS